MLRLYVPPIKCNLILLILISSYSLIAQKNNKKDLVNLNQNENKHTKLNDTLDNYLPIEGSFDTYDSYFSKILIDFNEPALYSTSDSIEVIRFTWIRSNNKPILIKLFKKENVVELIAKKLDSNSRFSKSDICSDTLIILSKKEWEKVIKLVKKMGFWEMKCEKEKIGLDGSFWILEAVNSTSYWAVIKWSPKMGKFKRCCKYLINKSGLQ